MLAHWRWTAWAMRRAGQVSPFNVFTLTRPPRKISHRQYAERCAETGRGRDRRGVGGDSEAYEIQKRVIGRRGPQLSNISEMLQTTSS